MNTRNSIICFLMLTFNFIPALLVEPSAGFVGDRKLQWVTVTEEDELPWNAVYAGQDPLSNTPHYVARVQFNGELAPAKILKANMVTWVSYEGKEYKITTQEVEVLTTRVATSWVPVSDSNIPPAAILGGQTANNTDYYLICRALYGSRYVPGKLKAGSNQCSYPQSGKEVLIEEYEVLTIEL